MLPLLALAISLFAPACGPAAQGSADKGSAMAPAAAVAPAAIDHAVWDALLKKAVKNGRVDYGVLKDDPSLAAYLDAVAKTDPASIADAKDRLAFWINAYNAHTVAAVLAHWPGITSVSTAYPDFGFFKNQDKVVGGTKYALNEIENEIIRKQFKDPRVHAALNCASVSCPPIAAFAFLGAQLDAQLDQTMRGFANDPDRNQIKADADTAMLSQIFNWYGDDFKSVGGPKAFLLKFVDGDRKAALEKATKVDFLPYDWNLNKI